MSVDYIVASLPALGFDQPASIGLAKFTEIASDFAQNGKAGGDGDFAPGGKAREASDWLATLLRKIGLFAKWNDLETQLRNAVAEARGGAKYLRPAEGCSLYWKNRVLACFQERDPLKRDEALDRVWWDAAGEFTPPSAPLGAGALATYAIRLKIALKRDAISRERGNAAFDRLTAATKRDSKGA